MVIFKENCAIYIIQSQKTEEKSTYYIMLRVLPNEKKYGIIVKLDVRRSERLLSE